MTDIVRKMATIRKVKEVLPIEGADKIELSVIDGWQCVTVKGEFKAGEYGVYHEIDSWLPIKPQYEFLRKSSYRKLADGSEGYRLRTMKLRKVLSQGLLMPMHLFPEIVNPQEGQDVSELLGVVVYNPPLPACLVGKFLGPIPAYIQRTDQERIQNVPEYFERYKGEAFEVTEKINGMSMTVYTFKDHFGVCGHNMELMDTEENSYWRMANLLGLKDILPTLGRNIAIQGELAGEGIQKNPYHELGTVFYVFDIWDIEKQKYLPYSERLLIFTAIKKAMDEKVRDKFKNVPIVTIDFVFQIYPTMPELLAYADGRSVAVSEAWSPGAMREGLVFKSKEYLDGEIVHFKVISNQHLLEEE